MENKKENKRLKRIINDLERDFMLQNELIKGNVLYLSNYDSKEEFRILKPNEVLEKISKTNKINSDTIYRQAKEISSLEYKLKDIEGLYKKSIEHKRWLFAFLLASALWSVFITATSNLFK